MKRLSVTKFSSLYFFIFTFSIIPELKSQSVNNAYSKQNKISQIIQIPSFKKIIIDSIFRSESITTADINQDGKRDIVIGDVWYEAPNWTMHTIRKPQQYMAAPRLKGMPVSKLPYYSNSFAVQTMDVNQDGWPDIICYPVMNEPVFWYENPKNTDQLWKESIAYPAYHGESPLMANLSGTDQNLPLAGFNVQDSIYHLGQIIPNKNPYETWKLHTIGHTKTKAIRGPHWDKRSRWFAPGARAHGLGVGDINGDGRTDVLTTRGWYEAPKNPKQEQWELHYMALDSMANPEYPQHQFAQLPIFDIDLDGDTDFFATSAHRYGLWWFEQIQKQGNIHFIKHDIPYKISQVHAVASGDMNNNGRPDLIIGKRWLAHTGHDPGWDEPIELLWLEPTLNASGQVEFILAKLDNNSGVGTQIEVIDLDGNGKEDVLTSSKKGTIIFLQE